MIRHHRLIAGIMLVVVAAASASAFAVTDDDGFVNTFDVKKANFVSTGRNDFFILEPGYQHLYEGEEDGKPGKLLISVLDETKTLDGVEARIVEEREWSDGKIIEISRNFFAIDKETNDVYYFGEDVDTYKNGKVTGHEGGWHHGENGAHYGLFMPAKPTVGQKFYQELAPKVAMDRFEIVSTTEKVKVPAGDFENVVKTKETTPIESGTEYKLYAPGVGLIVDSGLKLVKHGKNIEKVESKAGAGAKANSPQAAEAKPDPNANALVPLPVARDALVDVGADPQAEAVWFAAINDPNMSAHARSDLIEDLNEEGFADPHHVVPEELPLVMSRIALIEEVGPYAMDQVNADAFAEAYKDLTNIAAKLMQQ